MRIWEPRVISSATTNLAGKRRTWPPPALKEPREAGRVTPQQWQSPRASRISHWPCVVLVFFLASLVPPAHAQEEDAIRTGTLFFESSSGHTEAPRVHTDVDMDVSGIIANVQVRQRFHNPSDQWVEGTYAFPLPENSAVNRLHMQVGERIVEGEIREKAEAQQLFQQARVNGQRASVVHQPRPNIFRTAVTNIGPGETIVITITYLQVIDQQDGRYSLRFPLTITPRYVPGANSDALIEAPTETPVRALSPLAHDPHDVATIGDLQPSFAHANTALQSVDFEIDLDAGTDIEKLTSASHTIRSERLGPGYRVRLAEQTIAPDRDFELAWTPRVHGEPVATLFREQTAAGEHVLLMFMPPQDRTPVATPREVIFIIDTSGSMSGISIDQARAALLSGLGTLASHDTFNVIQFNSTHEVLFEQPVRASSDNLRRAREYVSGLRATGGTEMLSALSAAFAMPHDQERLRQILFITDGAVSNEDQLMRAIDGGLNDARLFTVGIGSAPNGHFMRTAAQVGRGTFTYIGSLWEVEERMNDLFHKLKTPVLTNIALQWPDGITPDYAPARITDLYAGAPIVVSARVDKSAKGVLTITGRSSTSWTRQISLDDSAARAGVATLWARHRVTDLMNAQVSGVSDSAIRAQVLPLALEYHLVTKYTSLIAVDKTPVRRSDEGLIGTRVENTKPFGQNWNASGLPQTATPAQLRLLIGALALLLAATFHWLSRRLTPIQS